MKTTLILLSSLSMLIHPVIAENAAQFGYGCGTGCRVSLTNKVVDLDDGIGQATFQVQTRGGVGGRNYSSEVTYLANCSKNLISREGSSWLRIDLTDNDRYATTQRGTGYYFDAICQFTAPVQTSSASRCQESINLSKRRIGGFLFTRKLKIDPRYQEFPEDKPYKLLITYGVKENPNTSTLIWVSQQILSNCGDVSIVSLGSDKSDNLREFGNINGVVREFQCLTTTLTPSRTSQPTPWHFIYCF